MIDRLKMWSDNCGITEQKPNRIDYVGNVVGELGEFYDAVRDNDENEIVDAIADIIVFSITEIFKAYVNYPVISAVYEDDEHYVELIQTIQNYGYNTNRNMFIYLVTKEIGSENNSYQYLFNTVQLCYTKLVVMGYDIRKVMNEVVLVLESRVGEWDDDLGKWIKDTSPEAKANWYKPDYSKCKL